LVVSHMTYTDVFLDGRVRKGRCTPSQPRIFVIDSL
jgi:hypothetical protein